MGRHDRLVAALAGLVIALTFVGAAANAEAVSQFLIQEQSVCCVPWDDAGPFLRFSVTYLAKDEKEEDELMHETVERLASLKLRW